MSAWRVEIKIERWIEARVDDAGDEADRIARAHVKEIRKALRLLGYKARDVQVGEVARW